MEPGAETCDESQPLHVPSDAGASQGTTSPACASRWGWRSVLALVVLVLLIAGVALSLAVAPRESGSRPAVGLRGGAAPKAPGKRSPPLVDLAETGDIDVWDPPTYISINTTCDLGKSSLNGTYLKTELPNQGLGKAVYIKFDEPVVLEFVTGYDASDALNPDCGILGAPAGRNPRWAIHNGLSNHDQCLETAYFETDDAAPGPPIAKPWHVYCLGFDGYRVVDVSIKKAARPTLEEHPTTAGSTTTRSTTGQSTTRVPSTASHTTRRFTTLLTTAVRSTTRSATAKSTTTMGPTSTSDVVHSSTISKQKGVLTTTAAPARSMREFVALQPQWVFLECMAGDRATITYRTGLVDSKGQEATSSKKLMQGGEQKWSGSDDHKATSDFRLGPVSFSVGGAQSSSNGAGTQKSHEKSLADTTRTALEHSHEQVFEQEFGKQQDQMCFWQWALPFEDNKKDGFAVLAMDLARTRDKQTPPRCSPGCATDLTANTSQYQKCKPNCF